MISIIDFEEYRSMKDAMRIKEANVFFEQSYAELLMRDSARVYYLVSDKYIMPLAIRRVKFVNIAEFISEPKQIAEGEESVKEFLNDCLKACKSLKVDFTNPTLAYSSFEDFPDGSKKIKWANIVVDLSKSEDDLFADLHSKHRNVIRKSEKDCLFVKFGREDLLDDYAILDNETWARSGELGKRDRYKKELEALPDNTLIAISYLEGVPQCGAIIFYNSECAYYMYGCSKNGAHNGAGEFLQFKTMLYMKSLQVKKYSFVGYRINVDKDSKLAGIQRFKERFGGELVEGYMFKATLNPIKKKLFDFAIKFKGIDAPDAIDQEFHKWN